MPFVHAFRLVAPDDPVILWDQVQIEEAPDVNGAPGAFTLRDTKAWPDQVTPGIQEPQEISTSLATLETGWFRFRWTDGGVPSPYTEAVYSPTRGTGVAYATLRELENYAEGWVTDPSAHTRLLERASRDIDSAVGARPVTDTVNGLKFIPANLSVWQRAALSRATCAQAEYRFQMGEEFMVRDQHTSERGPDFSTDGKLSYIAPKARRELAAGQLLHGPSSSFASVPLVGLGDQTL